MATSDPWLFPRLIQIPPRALGRKAVSIPDITQFWRVTQELFGVRCRAPTEIYASGVYNELFKLELDTPPNADLPKIVLARVARNAKTRSDNSLESEVATMAFVRQNCPEVPVPRVFGYCPFQNNAIGAPFSVVSFSEGVEMYGVPWEELPLESKLIGVRDFARIIAQLTHLNFKSMGSIYFKFEAQHSPSQTIAPTGFCLGPASWAKDESASRMAALAMEDTKRDRGPWKCSAHWLKASLAEDIQFIERLPGLAKQSFAARTNKSEREGERRLQLARRVLPRMHDCVMEPRDDPYDQCSTGPFVLGHLDLNPWNMIYAPKGPNAGHIVAIIDWEMSLTVPLWRMACYPLWFDLAFSSTRKTRPPEEARAFKDTYIRELQKHTRDALVLRVVQNAQYEARRRFAELAVLGWEEADVMDRWLIQNDASTAPSE
ncbi:Serine threonine protein kinase [Mycena indigotica]|uniref:Serine threonine protein kinase n=1 Tax=Mycena indigotica TaxID=2126181 RepID=A0A8H6SHD7_9AGAR|nr:Serine threonine protein kinase [Mycena indigotica]KAF7299496.1 Serine threonine protein kinase [Mycena indigotica]